MAVVFDYSSVGDEEVVEEGAVDVRVRWLIDRRIGADKFAMRMFELQPGGHTALHSHPWEHEVYVLEGRGVVLAGGKRHKVQAGTVVYIPPNEPHQFRNDGDTTLRMLCMIPVEGCVGR